MKDQNNHAFFILGMHRSGTSALTRICNLLGLELGSRLLPPAGDNETGFWEHDDIVKVHDELLSSLHSSWDDTYFLPNEWWQQAAIEPFKKALQEIVRNEFGDKKYWALKDPRLCRLMPLWLDIIKDTPHTPFFIISLRHPFDIMMSLKKRDGFSEVKSLLIWLQHIIEAEKWSRGYKRTFVFYDQLLQHPDKVVTQMADQLDITWPVSFSAVKEEVAQFLNPQLRHFNNSKSQQLPAKLSDWIDRAITIVNALGNNNDSQPFLTALMSLSTELFQWQKEVEDYSKFWFEEATQGRVTIKYFMTELASTLSILDHTNLQLQRKEQELAEQQQSIEKQAAEIVALKQSTSWKITAPLRALKERVISVRSICRFGTLQQLIRIMRAQGYKHTITKVAFILRTQGWQHAVHYLHKQLMTDPHYQRWIKIYDTLTPQDKVQIKRHIEHFAHKPLISIVMPVYNIEEKWLREAIESVLRQLYPYWELCIADDHSTMPHIKEVLTEYKQRDQRINVIFREKNGHISEASNSALALASGEFVALLDHDDVLPEHALYYVADAINTHPHVDLLYSDEDKIDEHGDRYGPYFKTDWNPDLFYSQNMFSHLGVYRKSLLEKIGGFRKGYEGSQDYDLCLRCLPHTTTDHIVHIPHILYHWRAIPGSTALNIESKNYAVTAARKAMVDYFKQNYPLVRVEDAEMRFGYHRIVHPLPVPLPMVTIIIPTKDNEALLRQCIASILHKTSYKNFEILIINNNSTDPLTLAYFKECQALPQVRVLEYPYPFNFSAINNFAVQHSQGEIMAFLNDDIEVIEGEWLREMVSHAVRPEVGCVGARLLFPYKKTLQHAGIILGVGSEKVAGHSFYCYPSNDLFYYAHAILTRCVSAVTAACMVVPKAIFTQVGGFNESDLGVAFNDVDLCLKITQLGYNIIYTPYAELYHHESASRGKDIVKGVVQQEKQERFTNEVDYMRSQWAEKLDHDPYYNPNLKAECDCYTLAFPPRVDRPWQQFSEENGSSLENAA